MFDHANTCREVWADSAYRSAETEEKLTEKHFRSRIHRRAKRNHSLSEREMKGNQTRSKVRARVEHVFGHLTTAMGGKLVRTIGIVRAKVKVGMQNLTYNMQRFTRLERLNGGAA